MNHHAAAAAGWCVAAWMGKVQNSRIFPKVRLGNYLRMSNNGDEGEMTLSLSCTLAKVQLARSTVLDSQVT